MRRLIHDGYVVTMDDRRVIHEQGYVLIESNGRIAAVGPMSECPTDENAERIDSRGQIVIPGLIDALHSHWSHLAPGLNLPCSAATALNAEAHVLAARLAAHALADAGVTSALLEIPEGIAPVLVRSIVAIFAESGVRGVPAAELAVARQIEGALISVRADTVSLCRDDTNEADIRTAYAEARAEGRRLLLRIAPDGADERGLRETRDRRGRSAIHHLMELAVLDEQWLVVSAGQFDDTDRLLIAESGCHVIGLPVADALRSTGTTEFSSLARMGVNCVLGSDGVGSGWTTDMVEQMKAAVLIQNTLLLDPTALRCEQALEMATVNAAKALGLETEIAMIAPGKRADIAVFDMRGPHLQAAMKPLSAFIACARATEATFVLAAGRPIAGRTQVSLREIQAAKTYGALLRAGNRVAA